MAKVQPCWNCGVMDCIKAESKHQGNQKPCDMKIPIVEQILRSNDVRKTTQLSKVLERHNSHINNFI